MVIFAKQVTQIYTLFNSLDKANMNSHNTCIDIVFIYFTRIMNKMY